MRDAAMGSDWDVDRRTALRAAATVMAAGLGGCAAVSDEPSTDNADPLDDLRASGTRDEGYWEAVRRQFSFAPGLIYMQNASRGPMPLYVVERLAGYAKEMAMDPRLVIEVAESHIEAVREKAAAFVGADPDEIAISRSTTHGINIVAHGMKLAAGDEVVLGSHEHPCCLQPWRALAAQDGVVIRTVDIPAPIENETELLERYEAAMSDRTRVIMVSQVTFTTGSVMPIKKLSEIAHRGGALLVVDAAHIPGMLASDVHALGCDAWSAGGGKWLMAPGGTGILYIKRDVQLQIAPRSVSIGWDDDTRGARRYERFHSWGERSIPEIRALGDLIEFHDTIGTDNVEARVRGLNRRLMDGLGEIEGVELLTSTKSGVSSGIAAFATSAASGDEIASRLFDLHGIHVRHQMVNDRSTVRVSTHVYNNLAEVDLVLDEVRRTASA